MKNKEELIKEISDNAYFEIMFKEKKNFNTKEKKDSDMIDIIKKIVEREVKKHGIQKD